MITRLDSRDADFTARWQALLAAQPNEAPAVREQVEDIISAVRARGDEAVLEFARRFDGETATSVAALEVSLAQCEAARDALPIEQREALELAADRIRAYATQQRSQSWEFADADGSVFGQRVTPLQRVGIYVPGGKASYPSSVLMNAIPAKVAGVGEIVMTAPASAGEFNPLVLAAASIAGVDRVFRLGGAQAVAALAYGTATVPAVDKIVGPGNAYVAAAKRQVFGQVGIDMIAGPSEVLIISDGSVAADWLAADLCAQAEHDELAQAVLLSPDAAHLDAVTRALQAELERQPRRDIIRASLSARGALVRVRDIAEAIRIANQLAPEHLELALGEPRAWLDQIEHAGAIFLGGRSPEAIGDYCAGPNHVLPTARSARFSSPLGVADFEKRSSIIEVSAAGARRLGPVAATLALGEGLAAHARSAQLRADD